MIGQIIGGHYQIVQQLGKGGFGITFIAIDTARPGNPQCVVKQFKPTSKDPHSLEVGKILFEREAQKLETLGNHDQIPRLLGYFPEQQEYYLVQEYIEGHDLSQEIVTGTQLSEADVIKLLHDILEVLTVVHQQNLIHRDLKPSNIRRRKSDGKIVLIDFGAVKEVTTQIVNPQGQINYTSFIHTLGYAPSEQLKGQPTFSSDIYALGVICIYALTGINPSPNGLPTNEQTGEIAWRDACGGRSHRTSNPVSPKIANIIDKMVYDGIKRSDRYQSAREVLQAVKGILPKSQPQKYWLAIGVIIVITPLIFWIGYQVATKITKPHFIAYENSDNTIKINHPENWIPKKPSDFGGEIIQFIPNNQNQVNSCPLELTVNVSDLPQILSLNEYKNTVLQKIKNNNPNSQINDASQPSTTLSGLGAYKLIYSRQEEQCQLQIMEIGTLKNGKAYYVTYAAQAKEYSKYLSVAEDMINSFEIVENK